MRAAQQNLRQGTRGNSGQTCLCASSSSSPSGTWTKGRGRGGDWRVAARLSGSTLMVVLLTVGILSVVSLASYLALVETQSRSILRSQAWNSALPVAEAGIEDAMAHIKNCNNNLTSDGWTNSGSLYSRQQSLGSSYYVVTISSTAPSQSGAIASTGYVFWKTGTYVGRTVQVTVASPFFQTIALAAQNISFQGGSSMDSYDTSTNLYSTSTDFAGYDPTKTMATGVIAVYPPGLNFAIGGNASIAGSVEVPPGGQITAKGSSSVGTAAWVNGGNSGIQANHGLYGFTNSAPDVVVPSYLTTAGAPASGTIGGTNYNYVVSGFYSVSNLTAGGVNTSIYVAGPSQLYVPGNVTVNTIVFAPNASLNLYVDTPALNITPNIIGAMPPQFVIWGTPSCISMSMVDGAVFVGFIYAPELNFSGAGHATFYGSITCKSLTCAGQFEMHYDCGRTNTPTGGYQIGSWAEL